MTGHVAERSYDVGTWATLSRRLSPYLDVAIALVATVMSVLSLVSTDVATIDPRLEPADAVAVIATAVAGLSLVWRRTRPMAVLRRLHRWLPGGHADRPLHRAAVDPPAVQPLLAGGSRRPAPGRHRAGGEHRRVQRPVTAGRTGPPDLGPAAGVRAAGGRVGPGRRDPVPSRTTGRAPAPGGAGGSCRTRTVRPRRHRGAAPDRPRAARRGRAQHVADRRAGRGGRARDPHRRGCRRARAGGDRRDQPQGTDPDTVDARACSATRTPTRRPRRSIDRRPRRLVGGRRTGRRRGRADDRGPRRLLDPASS